MIIENIVNALNNANLLPHSCPRCQKEYGKDELVYAAIFDKCKYCQASLEIEYPKRTWIVR